MNFPDFSLVQVQDHLIGYVAGTWVTFRRLRDGKNIGEAVTAVCHKAVQTDAWLAGVGARIQGIPRICRF